MVDRFRIQRHLGSGSLADVYLAFDQTRAQDVAIKVVDAGPLGSELAIGQLRGELIAYSKIRDFTHVLKTYDLHLIPWGGTKLLILSMEYANGGSFRAWLEQHAGDPHVRRTKGVECFEHLCAGVKAAHDAGVVNGDVKPDNALFVDGVLKMADCSISAVVQSLATHQTAPVQPAECPLGIGTPRYMSPDHFNASCIDDLDVTGDIYSLGVIFFELLHAKGRPPFDGSYERLRYLHTTAPVPILPEATETQRRVVDRCLEKVSSKRYACVDELLQELMGCSSTSQDSQTEAAGVEDLWQNACQSIAEQRLEEAQHFCRQILVKSPHHENALALQEDLQMRFQQAQQLYSAANQGMGSASLEELVSLVSEAVEAFPNHPAGHVVQLRLEVKARQYRQTMENGLACARRDDWEGALSCFESVRQLNPGATEPENAIRFATHVLSQIHESRDSIDRAVESGDWNRAMELARRVDHYRDEVRPESARATGNGEGHET
ncbi:MAG: protein kinase [Planctomycetota bacterium]|nr:protein kinase [Planctomycetota bacterium]